MNFQFHVPAFPDFQGRLDGTDYRRYDAYMAQFRSYATGVLNVQARFAERAVEKGYLREEVASLKTAIADITSVSAGCVEKASVLVEHEVSIARATIADEVEKLKCVVDGMTKVDSGVDGGEVVKVANESDVVIGSNWSRNVRNREARKARKLARQAAGVDWRKRGAAGPRHVDRTSPGGHSGGQAPQSDGGDECSRRARKTLEEKWAIENEYAIECTKRRLDVLKGSDVKDEINRRRTQVKRHTEANMVAIEKTHAFLSATGNVPGEPAGGTGFAETIVEGSISPESSTSMRDYRECQKKLLDIEAENERLRKGIVKVGLDPDLLDDYDKDLWTVDSQGDIPQESMAKLDKMHPSYIIDNDDIHFIGGKNVRRVVAGL